MSFSSVAFDPVFGGSDQTKVKLYDFDLVMFMVIGYEFIIYPTFLLKQLAYDWRVFFTILMIFRRILTLIREKRKYGSDHMPRCYSSECKEIKFGLLFNVFHFHSNIDNLMIPIPK